MFKRRGKKTFIVDATPVDLDFNKKTHCCQAKLFFDF